MLRPMVLAAGLLALLSMSPAGAVTREFTGTVASGAYYHIAIPDGWQAGDALVLYQHGLDFTTPNDPPGLGPLRTVMLAEGYAIAATSYHQRGWALFDAIDDNHDLLDVFEQIAGAPGEIVPFGGSMGGLIALKIAEAPGFPPVRGTYALCPAAAGARLWDAAIDLRLAFDVVCHNAGADTFPRGSGSLPWAFDLWEIPDNLGDLFDQSLLLPVLLPLNQCTGVNLPPVLRNDAMQERLDELMTFAHISDEDFFVTNMAYATYVMSELVRAPDKLDARNPFTTVGVDYRDDARIEAGIARIAADPGAAEELHRVSDFTGAIGSAKVLSMHTSRDELVIPANQNFVSAVVPADQRTIAIVDEETPTHCGFTDAEGIAGWEALRTWKDGAPQPDASSLQQQCEELLATGEIDGPCRFDANPQIAAFDSIVRPRTGTPPAVRGHSTHRRPSVPPLRAAHAAPSGRPPLER